MSTDSKSKVAKVLIVVALVAGAYAFGRYATPTKVIVTEKIVTVEKQVVVTQTKTEVQIVQVHDLQKDVHRVAVTEKKPDGTTVTTVTTDDKSKSKTDTTTNGKSETDKSETKLITQDKETSKVVIRDSKPQWSLTLQPGFEFGEALGLGSGGSYNLLSRALPMAPHMMANIGIEHRFVGPVFVGAWANTRLDAGLSIRLEW
jgi:hypothetical protein